MIAIYLLWIAFKRLLSRPGLTLLFLLTTALAIGFVTCVPVFAGAVSSRIMQEELGMLDGAPQHLRPITARFYASATPSRPLDIAEAERIRSWLEQNLLRRVGIPIDDSYMEIHSPQYDLMPLEGDTRYTARSVDSVYVIYADQVEQRLRLVDGAPFGVVADSQALNVWIPKRYADELNLHVGERFVVGDAYDKRIAAPLYIAGIWTALDPEDQFWWYTDTIWDTDGLLLTSRPEFERHIYPILPARTQSIAWQFILNEHRMNLSRAEHYVEGLGQMQREVSQRLPRGGMGRTPAEYLLRGDQRKSALTVVLLGFSLPMVAIVLYTISALSTVLARFQAQEVAMLNSRGGARVQIAAFSLIETGIVLLVATPLGLIVSLILARLLGYSTSFLQFEARAPLPVSLQSADWRLIALVLGAVAIARLAPTWRNAGQTIVAQERESARRRWLLGAGRLLGMGSLALAAYYGYYRLSQVGALALISWELGSSAHDPLLLVAPSLFFLAAPVFLSELFALLTAPVGWLSQASRSVAFYLGLQDLGREGAQYRSPVFMLILCVSLGVFYASLAKTADAWALDHRRYEVGSDLAYNPRGVHVVAGRFGKVDTESDFYEPAFSIPLSEFARTPGVEAATAVGEFEASVVGMKAPFVRLLAVDRLTFPNVAYFRADYAAEPLGALMNRLGSRQNSILAPQALLDDLSLGMGDVIRLNVLVDDQLRQPYEFVIAGAFDYFPTMFAEEAPLLVTNLDYIQSGGGGLLPYSVWMRVAGEVERSSLVQDIISYSHVIPERVVHLGDILARDRSRLERVGLLGVLSVCFMAGALLATCGLLVHNAAAMRQRALRFAVLQAIGLARGSVLGMIMTEYVGVLLYSVVVGAALGVIGARLYVPFYQLTEKVGVPTPPYLPLVDNERAALIALLMVAALVAVEGMVLWRLAHIRVFETLRLGTRE